MVDLIPVIKLDDRSTFGVWNVIPTKTIVVRLQDLVSKRTFKFNNIFHDIKAVGGVHNFLGYERVIILSLIMRDEIIDNFNPDLYSKVINTLKPDFYTTVDGWTYEGTESDSSLQIERCFEQTEALIKLCPDSLPLGLVKGCTEDQIDDHIALLKSIGITDFVFHVGDFSRHGDSKMMWRARKYARKIKRHANSLILYGMGSQTKMAKFSFADSFVTSSHFITANYGMKFVGAKKVGYYGKEKRKEVIKNNVFEMYVNIQKMNFYQTKLDKGGVSLWAEVSEGPVAILEDR